MPSPHLRLPPRFLLLFAFLGNACVIIEGGDTGSGSSSAGGTQAGPTGADTVPPPSTTTGTSVGTAAAADTGTAGGGSAACGWGSTGVPDPAMGYVCGGEGSDPSGTYPLACPDGLAVGAPCGEVTGVGCCDGAGNLWYCTTRGTLYQQLCG